MAKGKIRMIVKKYGKKIVYNIWHDSKNRFEDISVNIYMLLTNTELVYTKDGNL